MNEQLPVTFTSSQVSGAGRGKKIGVPTINMVIPQALSLDDGIYAATITISNTTFIAAVHLGPVPTYAQEKRSLEAHIIDLEDTKNLDTLLDTSDSFNVTILKYIRPIQHFSSTEALVQQIQEDVKTVRSICSKLIYSEQ